MKVLVAYYSRYGSTHECAENLKSLLNCQTDLLNISEPDNKLPIDHYDNIILGAPVYAGNFHRSFRNFIKKHNELLIHKTIGIFILCWEAESAHNYIHQVYPKALLKNSIVNQYFGYKIIWDKLQEIEKSFFQNHLNVKEDIVKIDHEAMQIFANIINDKLNI